MVNHWLTWSWQYAIITFLHTLNSLNMYWAFCNNDHHDHHHHDHHHDHPAYLELSEDVLRHIVLGKRVNHKVPEWGSYIFLCKIQNQILNLEYKKTLTGNVHCARLASTGRISLDPSRVALSASPAKS